MLRKFTESMRERVQMFVAEMQAETGLSVVEMILILVENLALYIEYIEGEKFPKNKLYTRYTQEHGQLKLSKKGK